MAAAARAILLAALSLVLSNSGVPSCAASLAAAPETLRMSPSKAVAFAPDTFASAVAYSASAWPNSAAVAPASFSGPHSRAASRCAAASSNAPALPRAM